MPASIYLFKFNNGNTSKKCEICLKLKMKTPERRHVRRSVVLIVNFEHITYIVSIVDFEQVNVSWDARKLGISTMKYFKFI